MRVLSIQSQVIFGHVGNNAAVFPLQRHGIEVWSVPTGLLAFNPSYGPPAHRPTAPEEMDAWIAALQTRPEWRQIDAVLLGWLGNPRTAEAAGRAALAVKRDNPNAIFLCDPVMGDVDSGLYVDPSLPAFIRDHLFPSADIITPNGFELDYLTGGPITDLPAALAACDALRAKGPRMVIATTLHRQDGGQGKLEALLVNADGAWLAAVPHLGEGLPKGAGDLFASLFLSQTLKGKPADQALLFGMAGTYTLLRDALENQVPEMRLEAMQDSLLSQQITPDIQRVR